MAKPSLAPPSRGPISLWLDDDEKTRIPPDASWTWVKKVAPAIRLMKTGRVARADLDNDLGGKNQSGYELVDWMAMNDCWPSQTIRVHSANVVAVARMRRAIIHDGPFREVGTGDGKPLFVRDDRKRRRRPL
jgi:hypothetical protein